MVECSRVRPFGDQLGEVVEPADTSTVVTYYSDVCDEVDAHFARALLHQQDTISPATSDFFLQNGCNGMLVKLHFAIDCVSIEQCIKIFFAIDCSYSVH